MSKKKKSGNKNITPEMIILVTAILQLLTAIIAFATVLLNLVG